MPAQKYHAIYQDLKRGIEEGLYLPETCIPTEYALVERYGCSRNTVRRAIQHLQELGYVQSIHGKGVIVIYRKELEGQSQYSVENIFDYYRKVGKQLTYRLLELRHFTAGEEEHEKGFQHGLPLCLLRRVRYVDDIPTSIETAFLTEKLVQGITEEIATTSINKYIKENGGEQLVSARRRVTVELASPEDLQYLDPSPCNCLAVLNLWCYSANGTLVTLAETRELPQYFSFGAVMRSRKLPD